MPEPAITVEGLTKRYGEVLVNHVFDAGLLARAVVLNVLYPAAGAAVFVRFFREARARGLLIQLGE